MGRKRFVISQPERDTLEMIAATADFRSGVWLSGRPYRNRADYVAHLADAHYLECAADGLLRLTDEGVSEALRSVRGVR